MEPINLALEMRTLKPHLRHQPIANAEVTESAIQMGVTIGEGIVGCRKVHMVDEIAAEVQDRGTERIARRPGEDAQNQGKIEKGVGTDAHVTAQRKKDGVENQKAHDGILAEIGVVALDQEIESSTGSRQEKMENRVMVGQTVQQCLQSITAAL